MKWIVLYISFLTVLTSCTGQTNTQTNYATNFYKYFVTGDTVNELSNNIMVIFQDTKNNYWFGSWQDGLYKYDGNVILRFTTQNGLPDNRVEEIKEDKLGNLYFNTSKGLCQYNGTHFVILTDTKTAKSDWKLGTDDLWFKCLTHSECVYRFDGKNLYRLKIPKIKLGEDYILKHPNNTNPYAIYCIYKDIKANIWFGTAQLGVFRYNGKKFDWITESDVNELHYGPSNGVRSIAEDKYGDFWFNTEYKYNIYNTSTKNDTNSQAFYKRIKNIGCLDGKKNGDMNEYLSITKDNNNNLWIAVYLHGVWKYDGKKITHYPIQVNDKNIPIYCLYKDNKGNIWLGTQENGVWKFTGQTFEKFAR